MHRPLVFHTDPESAQSAWSQRPTHCPVEDVLLIENGRHTLTVPDDAGPYGPYYIRNARVAITNAASSHGLRIHGLISSTVLLNKNPQRSDELIILDRAAGDSTIRVGAGIRLLDLDTRDAYAEGATVRLHCTSKSEAMKLSMTLAQSYKLAGGTVHVKGLRGKLFIHTKMYRLGYERPRPPTVYVRDSVLEAAVTPIIQNRPLSDSLLQETSFRRLVRLTNCRIQNALGPGAQLADGLYALNNTGGSRPVLTRVDDEIWLQILRTS